MNPLPTQGAAILPTFNRRQTLQLFASSCGLMLGCNKVQEIRKEPAMTFRTIEISGAEAEAKLAEYRSKFGSTGEYPFLISDGEFLADLQANIKESDQTPLEVLEDSRDIAIEKWIANRQQELKEDGIDVNEVLGEWPSEIQEKMTLGMHRDILSGEIKDKLFLGLASIAEPWQLPAVLQYGGWNECPNAEVQCAFFRQWQKEYGAEIVGVSDDVIECAVANPPTDQATALKLAQQQYMYCADIVDQGCETMNNLAATLIHSKYWFFWWD